VAGDSKLLVVFTGLSSCDRDSYILAVVVSFLLLSGGGINLVWGLGALLKEAAEPVKMKQACSSLVVVGASSLPVAWVFLSSCGVVVSSSRVSLVAPL